MSACDRALRRTSADAETVGSKKRAGESEEEACEGICPVSAPHSTSPFASEEDCVNRPPSFAQGSFDMSVPENSAPLTVIGTISANDLDLSQALT